MSFEAETRVWKFSKAKGADKLVLLSIASHQNENEVSWPSVPRLARMTNLSERQIYRSLKRLEQLDELVINHAGEKNRSNFYCVLCGLSDDEVILARSRIELKDKRPVGAERAQSRSSMGGDNLSGGGDKKAGVGGDNLSLTPDNLSLTPDSLSGESLINHKESLEKEEIHELWQNLMDYLFVNGQRALVTSWLIGCEPENLINNVLTVRCRSVEASRFLDSRVKTVINASLPGLLGRPASVHFIG